MGKSRWFFSFSGVILAAGAIAIATLGINFGIDFESGTRITTPLERPASVQRRARHARPARLLRREDPGGRRPGAGQQRGPDRRAAARAQTRCNKVEQALDADFGVKSDDFSANSIGPTFGEQIARTAVIAVIASLLLISIYIGVRFEFKFAVPVLIALAHDLLITAGVYALTDREVTTSTVAALLTILGYSLYDTVIVFDRIRENVPRMPRATFSQIANRSMSEVFTRSLATSFVVLMPVGSLLLFGGDTLKDFAFALLVGVASGAYSSIFIATPVLVEWKERERDLHAPAPARHGGERRRRAPVRVRDDRRVAEEEPAPRRPRERRAARRRPSAGASPARPPADRRWHRRRGGGASRGRRTASPSRQPPSRRRPSRQRRAAEPEAEAKPRRRRGGAGPRRAGAARSRSTAGVRVADVQAEAEAQAPPRKKHGRR